MDLLYSKYADPMSLMDIYIKQGRFGEFVYNMFEIERKQKEAESKKEEDRRYWDLYLHSSTKKSFNDWKDEVEQRAKANAESKTVGSDKNMTESDMENIITGLFPTINKDKK